MTKASLNEVFYDLIRPRQVNNPRGQPIPSSDDLCPRDRTERDRLGVPRFESNRSAGGDVEALAVGPATVERQR